MSRKTQIGWRVDGRVKEKFRHWVEEKHGKTRGKLGEELEKAMLAHIDEDGSEEVGEGVHEKLDEILAHVSESGEHTHTNQSGTNKTNLEKIAGRVSRATRDPDLNEIIIDVNNLSVGDERTLQTHKRRLKERQLLYYHPGQNLWYLPEEAHAWASAVEKDLQRDAVNELLDEHAMTMDEYDDILADEVIEEEPEDVESVRDELDALDVAQTARADGGE